MHTELSSPIFRSLAHTPTAHIADAFNDAFASYAVPVQMSPRDLEHLMRARSVDLAASYGLFDRDTLIAFVLNGRRMRAGQQVAYDSGTGVRQAYHGSGLGDRLIRSTLDALAAAGFQRYVLEVITENRAAIGLYTKHGFATTRELLCYRASTATLAHHSAGVQIAALPTDWEAKYATLQSYTPTWQNAAESIRAIAPHCCCLTTGDSAYGVLEVASGNLMQLGWQTGHRRDAVAIVRAAAAHTSNDTIKAINVDAADERTPALLHELAFEQFVTQYEMAYRWPQASAIGDRA